LKTIFDQFDTDQSGSLTADEIVKVVEKLSETTQSEARKETAKIFALDQGYYCFSE
jgi:Ca2+-binding EF-hand superfamily protein